MKNKIITLGEYSRQVEDREKHLLMEAQAEFGEDIAVKILFIHRKCGEIYGLAQGGFLKGREKNELKLLANWEGMMRPDWKFAFDQVNPPEYMRKMIFLDVMRQIERQRMKKRHYKELLKLAPNHALCYFFAKQEGEK